MLLAGDIRWLRPYGLLPHPNVLAGFLVIGRLSTLTGVIGLLDHYPWTLIQFQTAWWGLLAVSLEQAPQPDA